MEKVKNYLMNSFISNKYILIKVFSATFLWGILAHGYMFLNNSFSHDSLTEFYLTEGLRAWKMSIGRVLTPLYENCFRGFLTLPWLIGILALFYISLAVFLVIKIFNIRSTALTVLISGILTVNITVISSVATYINDFDCNMLGMLLAVCSVYLWKRFKYGFLFGAVPLALSLGFYQSFICTAITLVIIVLIVDITKGKDFKCVFQSGLKSVAMILLGGILYLGLMKLILFSYGVKMAEGGYNSLGNVFSMKLSQIIENIVSTYKATVQGILQPTSVFTTERRDLLSKWVFATGLVAFLINIFNKKVKILSKLLAVLLLLLLPIGMNVTRILSNGMSHDLMHYALWLSYILVLLQCLICAKQFRGKIGDIFGIALRVLASLLIFIVVFANVRLANSAYLAKDFQKDATLSYFTRVLYDIEGYEGYVEGETKVAFIGKPYELSRTQLVYDGLRDITGLYSGLPLGASKALNYERYFKYVLITPIAMADDKITDELRQNEKVQSMPIYPDKECMSMIDGVLVVRLGLYE